MRTRKFVGMLAGLAASTAALTLGPTGLPTAQAATAQGFEIVYQNTGGRLVQVSPGIIDTTLSFMAPQTGSALVALPDGNFDEAFQASDRSLWFANSTDGGHQVTQPCSTAPFPVAPGTTPALAVDAHGNLDYEISEGGSEVSLLTPAQGGVCSTSRGDIRAGTSPSVVALNTGAGGFVSAWVGGDGLVRVNEPGKGTHIAGNGLPAAPGTSPSIAINVPPGQIPNGWKLAYHDTANRLTTVDSNGNTVQTPSFLAAGTSPSVSSVPGRNFEMAFVASDSSVWMDVNGNGHPLGSGLTAAPNTNATIAQTSTGGWEIAFQHSGTSHLTTFDSNMNDVDTGQAMAAGTSPSIVSLFPFSATPPNVFPARMTLSQQPPDHGFPVFAGTFPIQGIPVSGPGSVVSITYPMTSTPNTALLFVKPGHTTAECGDPTAVVALPEGGTLNPPQLSPVFGTTSPQFSNAVPLFARACFSGPNPPASIALSLSVVFN